MQASMFPYFIIWCSFLYDAVEVTLDNVYSVACIGAVQWEDMLPRTCVTSASTSTAT
jgi:hypothetical protein